MIRKLEYSFTHFKNDKKFTRKRSNVVFVKNRQFPHIIHYVKQAICLTITFEGGSRLEANHSQNHGVPIFFPTECLSDLLQNHMSISTNRAHAEEACNWTKIKGGCQLRRKVVAHDSKSDYPLPYVSEHIASSLSCTERTL